MQRLSLKRVSTLCALLFIGTIAGSAAVKADAVSDQKKIYKALGVDLSKNKPALCNLLSKAEVEQYLGKPVRDGTSAGPVVTGCAWVAADGSGDGILVTRDPGAITYPPTHSKSYKPLAGFGDKAYTNYDLSGSTAEGHNAKGATEVLIQRSGNNTRAAVDALRAAMKR